MNQRTIAHAALLALTAASFAAAAPAGKVGVDNRSQSGACRPLATGPEFAMFRAAIVAEGHIIVPLNSFEAPDLVGLDAIIVRQPFLVGQEFSASEIAAIQAFIANDGGAYLFGEGGNQTNATTANFNDLVAPYGVVYDGSPNSPSSHTISNLVAHPVTTDVSSFGVDFQRSMASIASPAIDLTVNGGIDDALAAVAGARGNVVLGSDGSMWFDPGHGSMTPITFADNLILLENILDYIVGGSGECFLVFGAGFGAAPWAFSRWGHAFETQVDRVSGWYPVLMNDLPEFVVYDPPGDESYTGSDTLPWAPRGNWNFTVQVLMWNPGVFPTQPEQFTHGLAVFVSPTGDVRTIPYGRNQGGMKVWAETYHDARGRKILRFPFSVSGM